MKEQLSAGAGLGLRQIVDGHHEHALGVTDASTCPFPLVATYFLKAIPVEIQGLCWLLPVLRVKTKASWIRNEMPGETAKSTPPPGPGGLQDQRVIELQKEAPNRP